MEVFRHWGYKSKMHIVCHLPTITDWVTNLITLLITSYQTNYLARVVHRRLDTLVQGHPVRGQPTAQVFIHLYEIAKHCF